MSRHRTAEVEAALDRAHRNLWVAYLAADRATLLTLAEDLSGVLQEVERLQLSCVAAMRPLRASVAYCAYPKAEVRDGTSPPAR